jgi:hypothetical protein
MGLAKAATGILYGSWALWPVGVAAVGAAVEVANKYTLAEGVEEVVGVGVVVGEEETCDKKRSKRSFLCMAPAAPVAARPAPKKILKNGDKSMIF